MHHPWIAHRAWSRANLVLTNDASGAQVTVTPEPAVLTNHIGQVLAFLLSGAGIGAIPEVTALRPVEQGTLTRVLRDWTIVGGQLVLLWSERRHPAPRVRAFIDFATEYFARDDGPLAPPPPNAAAR